MSISKRAFKLILDVNELELNVDMGRLTKDASRVDQYATKLHMLLLDDPLIGGKFLEGVKLQRDAGKGEGERKRRFVRTVEQEEQQFATYGQQQAEEKMRVGVLLLHSSFVYALLLSNIWPACNVQNLRTRKKSKMRKQPSGSRKKRSWIGSAN